MMYVIQSALLLNAGIHREFSRSSERRDSRLVDSLQVQILFPFFEFGKGDDLATVRLHEFACKLAH